MNKKIRQQFSILFILILILFPSLGYSDVPYSAWTLNPGGKIVPTQIPYIPLDIMEGNFNNPEDLFIDNDGNIYVADTGNGRIAVINNDTKKVSEIGVGVLNQPTGVFVSENNDIYVADYGNEAIYVFKSDGKLLNTFKKPDSLLFGKQSKFKPKKLVVDKRGNIYIISEGSTNGVIQLNNKGEFLGYFGVNSTNLGFLKILQRFLYTESQISQLFKIVPPSPDNIAIDKKSIIYTDTRNINGQNIKKLNVAGLDMFEKDKKFFPNDVGITVDNFENIFTVDERGFVYEYDNYGNLLFVFGNNESTGSRIGEFKNPSSIAVDNSGHVYVLDKDLGDITVFKPTEFAIQVHKGIYLYNQGLYVESQKPWENTLRMNSDFLLAHKAIGKAFYKQQEYNKAMLEFKLSEDRKEYSNTYWEIRQDYLMKNLGKYLIIFLVLWLIKKFLNIVDKKVNIFSPIKDLYKRFFQINIINDLNRVFGFIKHPINYFYELRWENKPGVMAATILYIFLFVIQIIRIYFTGFIFNYNNFLNISLFTEALKIYIPILLWVVMNYLVSNINDGEGRFKDVYIGTAYALSPYIVFSIPLALVSNILTLNEAFLYTFGFEIIYVWSIILIYIMIVQIHDYPYFKAVGNILTTIFAMFIVVLVSFILYIVWSQFYAFIYDITQEVITRV
ncbi:MAG: YIP1 family protein [Thermoanaerobacteraceae bacterium]